MAEEIDLTPEQEKALDRAWDSVAKKDNAKVERNGQTINSQTAKKAK